MDYTFICNILELFKVLRVDPADSSSRPQLAHIRFESGVKPYFYKKI